MKEGVQEADILDVVKCQGFKKLMTVKTCKDACEYFGGIHKEPVKGRVEGEKELKVIRHDLYIICNKPRLVPFEQVGEVIKEKG